MRFATAGFNTAEQFYTYLKDSFDVLYAEGETAPKMMSVGMHCRLLGRPGRFRALQRFLDYIQQHDKVWVCTRQQLPTTGAKPIRIAGSLLPLIWPSPQGEGTARSRLLNRFTRMYFDY
jgi:hypothetical protein